MKKRLNHFLPILLIGVTTLLLQGCSEKNNTLTVAAASSLTEAFTEAGKVFEAESSTKVVFNFGSTGTLKEQIINGAPFDIFAAADEKSVVDLANQNYLLQDSVTIYGVGRLGIATLKDSKIPIENLENLLSSDIKKIAIANPETAPYGTAAKEVLINLGYFDSLEEKLVYGKNISETLNFVTTGNAEIGFVALSLKNDEILDFTLLEDTLHTPLKQALGILEKSTHKETAKQFIKFLKSEKGQEILLSYGFMPGEE